MFFGDILPMMSFITSSGTAWDLSKKLLRSAVALVAFSFPRMPLVPTIDPCVQSLFYILE
jgi:hypothetical protein